MAWLSISSSLILCFSIRPYSFLHIVSVAFKTYSQVFYSSCHYCKWNIFHFPYPKTYCKYRKKKSNYLLIVVGFLLEVLKCFDICSCINKNSCISSSVHDSNFCHIELAETSKRILSNHSDHWQICLISDFR